MNSRRCLVVAASALLLVGCGSARPTRTFVVTRPASARATLPAAGRESMTWEGMVRRMPGLRFGGRWSAGTLEVKEGQLRWLDAGDIQRNLLIPESAIREQFRTCLKQPGGNPCFEWGFRTIGGEEYVFRDVRWEQGIDDKVEEVHSFFASSYPALVDYERPVEKM